MQQKITKTTKYVRFSTVFHHKCKHILVTVDTSSNYALISGGVVYKHGWPKCLNIHCVSEACLF